MTKQLFSALKISFLALSISFGISYALAWTAPTVAPPNGNVTTPINTSTTAQTKAGELIGSLGAGYGQFRAVSGNYGVMLRNDGTNTYLLSTASGDQYGSWSTLRPFSFNNSTGLVTMSNGLSATTGTFSGALSATGVKLTTGAALNKVLTSDASGNGTWTTAASGLSGFGTTNSIPKWTGSSSLGNSEITDDGTTVSVGYRLTAYQMKTTNITNTIAPVDTNGAWTWTRVVSNTYAPGPGNNNSGYKNVPLDANKPVLGIRISGSTDDGGVCTAGVSGYFFGGVTQIAYLTDLDIDGTWNGMAWNNGAAAMATGTWIFENTAAGRNLGAQSYTNNVAYNKPAGLTYIPARNYLSYNQWYNDGQGGYGNTCYVDVLYGTSF